MFSQFRGNWEYKYFQKTASTVFSAGQLVAEGANGQIVPALAASTALIGIVEVPVTATDANFASNDRILVAVPRDSASEFVGPITTGTIAITDENSLIDLTDADGADATAAVTEVLKIKEFQSTTLAVYTLNKPTIV